MNINTYYYYNTKTHLGALAKTLLIFMCVRVCLEGNRAGCMYFPSPGHHTPSQLKSPQKGFGLSSSLIYFAYKGWGNFHRASNNATHPHSHYKMPIYILYVPVWICLGRTVTNGGDVVKVFMLCNPTVYLLVIQASEGKHILCLISHLLSGWIHSFSRMPYEDNSRTVRGWEAGCAPVCTRVNGGILA